MTTHGPEETSALGAAWAKRLRPGHVLALIGDLGAGKTCFVQGLALGLNLPDIVHSPTFTLVNEYPGPVPLIHIDLYRIHSPDEALDLGVEEYFAAGGITVIEWAERLGDYLPAGAGRLRFENGPDAETRIIIIEREPAP